MRLDARCNVDGLRCLLPNTIYSEEGADCACQTDETVVEFEISEHGAWHSQIAEV
jgi:hypothetical protein